MSATENTRKICSAITNNQSLRDVQEIRAEANNKTIVKYEEKDKALICDRCTLLRNLKDTITNIYHSTVKSIPDESDVYENVRNFCELDLLNDLCNSAHQDNCDSCRRLKSETNVTSSNNRQKHKHKLMKRSESQMDNRSKNSSAASGLQQKGSRTSRSLVRNTKVSDNSVNPFASSKEELLKWKNEIETLEIKRQVFTAVGENKSKGFRTSRDKEKSSRKQQKKKAEIDELNEQQLNTNSTENKINPMNEECLKIDTFLKKDLEDIMKIKTNKRSKKKRNNSPNLPIQIQPELNKINLKEKLSPVPQELMNFICIDLKENLSPKLIRLHDGSKQRSASKSKKTVDNEAAKRNEKELDKDILDVFTKADEVVKDKVKSKHKDKEEHKIKKHRKKEQTDKSVDKTCSKHSISRNKIVTDEELNQIITTPKTPLLFGVDYLTNSQALQKQDKIDCNEAKSCDVPNENREEFPLKDRKEMSISNLNLSPIIDHYARNKSIIESIFNQSQKRRHQPKQSKKSDELSINSDIVTSKEKTLQRHRQNRMRHYSSPQAKSKRLINQTTNHMISDENLIEVSTKTLANDVIKSSVEGIEPPRRIVNKTYQRKSNSTALKHNSLLHMTFLKPVAFPEELKKVSSPEISAAENLSDKVEVVDTKVVKDALPLRYRSSTERKSKISVLYEHRSNSARRKELRNKICNHQRSKQSVVNSRGKPDEAQPTMPKVCANPDVVRRVSFARNSIKPKQKCSKCHGIRRVDDKSISANISEVPKQLVNKTKKISSKKMCSVDTQTDLLEYKNITTTDHKSQTTAAKIVNKQCSPIMIGIPGVHKSDTNVIRKEHATTPNNSKLSAYQKLQSAVMSLFENTKYANDDEMGGISKMTNKNDSQLPNNSTIEENDDTIVKRESVTQQIRPNSPIYPTKIDVLSARIKSDIPKPTRSPNDSQDNSQSESKPKDKLSKNHEKRHVDVNDGVSNSIDFKVLQDCIEDLISVLNGIKEKSPKNRQICVEKTVVPDDRKRLISSDSVDTSERVVSKKLNKRQALNVLSSTSVDSNRDSSAVQSSSKRKSHCRKSKKKLSRHQLVDEWALKSVFKNKNCRGSGSLTQFSSSGHEFRNIIKENGAGNNELDVLKDLFCKNNVTNHKGNEIIKPVGVGNLLVEEPTIAKNYLYPELLGNLPTPKKNITALQKAEGTTAIDYKYVMEQLVYMFTQKPPPKDEAIVSAPNRESETSSSNFSADSLEQSFKYEPANSRNMPPKNCNFFVYTSTIELDKDMKDNLQENNLRSFASFKNQNKLSSYSNVSSTTSRSSYTVSSNSSGYGTGKKSASLKNFFKKGSSLLDLFKHKQTNSVTINPDVTNKCEITTKMPSENADVTEDNLLAGFSPAQYWFSICPQKENSLETVHEGVQVSPETTETTTMRKWADNVTNQSIQTKSSIQSNQELPTDNRCYPPGGRCRGTSENVLNEPKSTKQCKCKREYWNKSLGKEPLATEVADFILNTLLDNVMNTIQAKADEQSIIDPSKPQRLDQKDNVKSTNEDDTSIQTNSSEAAKTVVKEASDKNTDDELDDRKPREIKPIDDEFEDKVGIEKLRDILMTEEAEKVEEFNKTLSAGLLSVQSPEPDVAIEKQPSTKSKSAEPVEPENTPLKPSFKLKNNDPSKGNVTIAKSISNKEVFERMFKAYEKEEILVERMSMDDELFEKEIATIKSNVEIEEPSKSVPSDEYLSNKTLPHEPAFIPYERKRRDTAKKILEFFRKKKHSVKDIMSPMDDDVSLKQAKWSTHQLGSDTSKRASMAAPGVLKSKPSKSKDMRFEEEDRVNRMPQLTRRKTMDCSPVEVDDIGTCFARGFRPDNLALSGDACFNFNKQDKYVLSPNLKKTEETIIDFSERQTPLDYLLALGFMVDEASNALKDEDIRSRLLAAITEVDLKDASSRQLQKNSFV